MPKRPKPAPAFTLRHGESISFVLPVTPRTKKNSREHATVRGRTVPLPSKVYRKMADQIRIWALTSSALDPLRMAGPWGYATLFLAQPLNCTAIFYRDALRGDAVGYYQGLADALEAAGIVADDKWITQWDGSRLAKDAERSRIEVTLTAL
jgi:Holliday junction resolvase RusA-like endonuclease